MTLQACIFDTHHTQVTLVTIKNVFLLFPNLCSWEPPLEDDKDPFIPIIHYYGCCCSGDARNQVINSLGIDLVVPEFSSFRSKIVNSIIPWECWLPFWKHTFYEHNQWLMTSAENAVIWVSVFFNDDKSILVHVVAWCHQATSHYLNNQCDSNQRL